MIAMAPIPPLPSESADPAAVVPDGGFEEALATAVGSVPGGGKAGGERGDVDSTGVSHNGSQQPPLVSGSPIPANPEPPTSSLPPVGCQVCGGEGLVEVGAAAVVATVVPAGDSPVAAIGSASAAAPTAAAPATTLPAQPPVQPLAPTEAAVVTTSPATAATGSTVDPPPMAPSAPLSGGVAARAGGDPSASEIPAPVSPAASDGVVADAAVSPGAGTTAARVHQTVATPSVGLAERVERIVEQLELVKPPASIVVDLGDSSLRVTVSLRGGVVHVAFASVADDVRGWIPELFRALSDRGFELEGDVPSRDESRQPETDDERDGKRDRPRWPRPSDR